MKSIYDFYDYSDVNEYTINNLEDDIDEIESLAESVQLRSKKKDNMMTYEDCEDCEKSSIPFDRHDNFEKKNFRGFKYDQNNLALERNPTAELKYLDGEWPAYETEALENSIDELKNYVDDLNDKNKKITKSLKKKFKYLVKK